MAKVVGPKVGMTVQVAYEGKIHDKEVRTATTTSFSVDHPYNIPGVVLGLDNEDRGKSWQFISRADAESCGCNDEN